MLRTMSESVVGDKIENISSVPTENLSSHPEKKVWDNRPNNEEVDNNTDPLASSKTTNNDEFTRANVEALGNRVRITDTDEKSGLELFCYVKCHPNYSDVLKQCRGVVFNNDQVVMKAFPYTVEYNCDDVEKVKESLEDIFSNCTFYESHEGTLLRMFYFDGKWFTSTHRKLNAFKSKWSSRESFGTLFKKALEYEVSVNKELSSKLPSNEDSLLERFQSTLDKSKQYMFLVKNTEENRIVCDVPSTPTVYHVGTFVDKKLVLDEDIKIPYPRKLTFSGVSDLCEYVKTKISYHNLQGVIVFTPNNTQYKILTTDYQELFRARGNEPSVKYRFLQVLQDKEKVDMLYYLYPDMRNTFDDYMDILFKIGKQIHNAYVKRFIHKEHVKVPVNEYAVITACHSWYNEDRTNRYVNLKKVMDVLLTQPATNLNHMIRCYKLDERKVALENANGPRNGASVEAISVNTGTDIGVNTNTSGSNDTLNGRDSSYTFVHRIGGKGRGKGGSGKGNGKGSGGRGGGRGTRFNG